MYQTLFSAGRAWLHMVNRKTAAEEPHLSWTPRGRGAVRCCPREGTPRQSAGRAAQGTPSAGWGPPSCSVAGRPACGAMLVSARPSSACSPGLLLATPGV